jgi:hypothetical protein
VECSEDDYRPPAYERLLIHNFLVLNYIAKGDINEAVVAARKYREVARDVARGQHAKRLDIDENAIYIQWVSSKVNLISFKVAHERAQRLEMRNDWSTGSVPPNILGHWLGVVVSPRALPPRHALAAIDHGALYYRNCRVRGVPSRRARGAC